MEEKREEEDERRTVMRRIENEKEKGYKMGGKKEGEERWKRYERDGKRDLK